VEGGFSRRLVPERVEDVIKEGLLESWKEISLYLGRCIRTCQLWERRRELPIHRLESGPKPRVFAYKSELDRWRGNALSRKEENLWHKLAGFLHGRRS
jgi:hypothetical protein